MVIQVKNKKMKNIFSVLGIIALSVALFSCSATKKLAEPEQVKESTDTISNDGLSEKKRMEFEYLFVEALNQKMLGNTQNATQLLSNCLDIDPNSSAAMYELANIHAANNDFTSASLLLEKAITIDDTNVWYKQLLAQIYQQMRKFSEAADIYAQLLKKDPDNQEYLYTKAILLTNAQKYNEAIQTYNTLEKETGINEQISVAKQQLYVLNNQVDKAFEEIKKLIDYNPTDSKYYGLLADLYLNQGDRENALKYYNKIQEMDPDNGFVHFSLANYYLSDNEPGKAFEETEKGFSSESVDLHTKLQMYMVLASNRDKSNLTNEQEERLIQILRKEYPDEYLVHTIYADYLLRNNKLAEGREQLLEALDIQNNDYMLWQRVLYIDNDLQEWQKLYDHSKEATDLFPNQSEVYLLHAVACIQLEKYDETIKIVDEGMDYVVDNKPLEGQFLMLKGEATYKENKLDDAFKLFDKALELDPDNYTALNNYAYYLSLDGRDLDKAERMSGKVVEKFPENSTYLDTHAWVLFKKGEYTLAKFYMESAIENGGEENATLLEHYGDILFKLKKQDEAKKYWEKARDLGGTSDVLQRKISEKKYFDK